MWSAIEFKQQIYLQKLSHKMFSCTSEYEGSFSGDEGQELIPGRRYVKKTKALQKKSHKVISSTDKKKRCELFNQGACDKGSLCKLSHSFIPDVAKKVCKLFLRNSCSKGESCHYSHNTKRYPCKFFHIQQNCCKESRCRFSHNQVDSDFEDEFLEDNQKFLLEQYHSKRMLPEKYQKFIFLNDLLNKEKKGQLQQNSKTKVDFPLFIGFPLFRFLSQKQSQRAERIVNKKYEGKKNITQNWAPFSIRLSSKNRPIIPERLQNPLQMENNQIQEAFEARFSSSCQKIALSPFKPGDKISHEMGLTPDSKSSRQYNEQLEQSECMYF